MAMQYLRNVSTLRLATEKCIGCGACTRVCPHQLFWLEGKKVRLTDPDSCMECGACALNCPADALSVRSGVGCATALLATAFGFGASDCC